MQQFVGSFGLDLSSGGAVFAAYVIATFPMFVLVGFTMRYFVSGLTGSPRTVSSAPLTPAGLRCAYRVNPLGVAPGQVRLSWLLHGPGRDRAQSGYQVQVAGGRGRRGHGPGSGLGPGGMGQRPGALGGTRGHRVRGPALRHGGRYAWRVRAWDEPDAVSGWSDPAWFEVELDPTTGWRAVWIG